MSDEMDSRMEQDIERLGLNAPRVEKEHIDKLMELVNYQVIYVSGTTTTLAIADIDGFTLATGWTACVDPDNFNPEYGAKYAIEEAREQARNKLWELEVYKLKFSYPSRTIDSIAQMAHEVNAAYCLALGDASQPTWEDAPQWQKQSAINGVRLHLDNPGTLPSESHVSWLREKRQQGWVYGEVKDIEKKTHPCCVDYEDLPIEQKAKDYLFKAVVETIRKQMDPRISNKALAEVREKNA